MHRARNAKSSSISENDERGAYNPGLLNYQHKSWEELMSMTADSYFLIMSFE